MFLERGGKSVNLVLDDAGEVEDYRFVAASPQRLGDEQLRHDGLTAAIDDILAPTEKGSTA